MYMSLFNIEMYYLFLVFGTDYNLKSGKLLF